MIYQCEKWRKAYSQKKLIEEESYKITKEGLMPFCPNCKCEEFIVTDLIRLK